MPGIAGGHKGAWSSQAAKRLQSVGALRSTGAAWREAHLGDHRGAILGLTKAQNGGTHLGLRRNAFPFAGSCGKRRSSGDSPRVRAEWSPGARTTHERFRLPQQCAHDERGARSRFEEGTRPPKDGANLCSAEPGPAGTLLREHEPARLVSPVHPREGAARGEGSERSSRLALQNEESALLVVVPVRRRIAEVGRTPSGSEKRAIGESSGRKPGSPTKPVNGNLTTLGAQARKRRRPRAAKGGRFFEARRSSSRERRRDRRRLRSFVRAPARARCA